MKTEIKTNGKIHIARLTAENIFEDSIIKAIHCYEAKATLQREVIEKDQPNPVYETLIITMEE